MRDRVISVPGTLSTRGRQDLLGHPTSSGWTSLHHPGAKGSRPISRVLSRAIIPLGPASPRTSSGLPGGARRPALHPLTRTVLGAASLFGLAPGGVCRADLVTKAAVRSYRTVSPLPARNGLRRFAFCCTFRGLTPPRCYLAPGLPEPGLSSTPYAARTQQRLPGRLPVVTLHAFMYKGICTCKGCLRLRGYLPRAACTRA